MSLDALNSQRATSAYLDTLSRANPTTSGGVTATPAPPPTDANQDGATTATPGAIIALSPSAQFFAQVLSAAQGAPDVRADKLAAAQARMAQSPDTQVDVAALAAKLLAHGAQ